jgi:cytosine permease
MSTKNEPSNSLSPTATKKEAVFVDDFSMERVPPLARRPVRDVLWVRLGVLTAMSQFVLGAALGFGMTFWKAFWAIIIGSVLLEVVALLIGIAGAWEGLPTGLLARWSGFGKYGSGVISIVVATGSMAWFGVQNSIFADALNRATRGHLGLALCSILTGLFVTLITVFGFRWLAWTAAITVPAFVSLVGYGVYRVLATTSLPELVHMPSPGPQLTVVTGATMVAGGYMLGAVVTPDIARFCRNGKDVFWMTVISTFLGELGIGLAAVLLAHAVRTQDVVSIIFRVAGWIGITVVSLATIKINDVNLYGSSLHITNAIQALFHRRLNRGAVTAALGGLGTLFSILGVLKHFVGFLLILGVAVPPIGGVMVMDYFILKRDRVALATTRVTLSLPESCEWLNPVGILAWAFGFSASYAMKTGIPSLNSILASALFYFVGMKLLAYLERRPTKRFAMSSF